MTEKEILEKLHVIYGRLYNPDFLSKSIYTEEKAQLDRELKDLQSLCSHTHDSGETAIEDNYCNICGGKI